MTAQRLWEPSVKELPLPPIEYRRLVGPTQPEMFDNPSGQPVFGHAAAQYESVLDFGCGCGRLARQMMQQNPRPRRYMGIDLHQGMIDWCRENLSPHAPAFLFQHHNVLHPHRNPGGSADHLPFPAADRDVSLFIAHSVFTHLLEPDAEFYIRELARVLRPDGVAMTTWFLFDKGDFPMMQEFQNALFINAIDPTNAVIYDKDWLLARLDGAGLLVTAVTPPSIRGFQWSLRIEHQATAKQAATFPEDRAPRGLARPPIG
jgi:SAM-dependent methyltransferase